jgi:hypothetical protein
MQEMYIRQDSAIWKFAEVSLRKYLEAGLVWIRSEVRYSFTEKWENMT